MGYIGESSRRTGDMWCSRMILSLLAVLSRLYLNWRFWILGGMSQLALIGIGNNRSWRVSFHSTACLFLAQVDRGEHPFTSCLYPPRTGGIGTTGSGCSFPSQQAYLPQMVWGKALEILNAGTG